MFVVALGLAIGSLVLLAEMAAAGFVALQRVDAQQLAEFEKVRDAAGFFEALIQIVTGACHVQVLPELVAERANFGDGFFQAGGCARHAAVFPHDLAQFAMEGVDGALAFDRQQFGNVLLCGSQRRLGVGMRRRHFAQLRRCEIVADGVGNDEVAVGQALHQGAGAEAIGAVVGEIRFAEDEQSGDRALQLVIDPEAAHRVVNGRIDAHRDLVGILVGDALIHVEEIAVAFADGLDTEARNRVG